MRKFLSSNFPSTSGLNTALRVTNSDASGSTCKLAPWPGGESQVFSVTSEVNTERVGWGTNSVSWRSLSGNHTSRPKKQNKIILILPQRVEHGTETDVRCRALGTGINKMLQDCANGEGRG